MYARREYGMKYPIILNELQAWKWMNKSILHSRFTDYTWGSIICSFAFTRVCIIQFSNGVLVLSALLSLCVHTLVRQYHCGLLRFCNAFEVGKSSLCSVISFCDVATAVLHTSPLYILISKEWLLLPSDLFFTLRVVTMIVLHRHQCFNGGNLYSSIHWVELVLSAL